MPEAFGNFIGGAWLKPDLNTFESRNPARPSDVLGTFPESDSGEIDRAVQAAATAFRTWSRTPAPQRGEILRRLGDILTRDKDAIAREMTREMGKPFTETRGDVQEAIDTAYYAASETRRLFGHTVPSELPDKFNMSIRRPLGVCGIITAWNFPVA
ncbi:MAG TPA: aldehyde dehydrogenase family protein, partial [Rhodothermales bacterium]